jgi:1,4-dihydroxy-2-naphthoate octaprenyltransferase
MASRRDWLGAARPRTLPAAVVPVLVGAAVARAGGTVAWGKAALALVVALALQVGTNYANDYADGVRGTDAARVGPVRLVAGGLAPARAVRAAALAAFAVAAVAGLALSLWTSPVLLALGAASIAAGWLYTGGPRPYGYVGLGEVFVFAFFGLAAVVGTAYVASGHLAALAFAAACPVGLVAVALLVVNNLRDLPSDAAAGKRTLAVRLGARRTRLAYTASLGLALALGALLALARPLALLALLAAPLALRPTRVVRSGAEGRALVPALAMTGAFQLAFGTLLAVGIAL